MTAVRRSLANRLLSGSGPVQDLLRCAKHLFVATGSSGNSEHEPEGQSVFEGLKFSGTGGVFLDVLNSPLTFSDERTLQ
jgi:hypothetical protein